MNIRTFFVKFFLTKKQHVKKQWQSVIRSAVQNAETAPKEVGIAFFNSLLKDVGIFEWEKRNYIKEHFKKYKEQIAKTGST